MPITVRSADGAEFHVSRQFLADASPLLEAWVAPSHSGEGKNTVSIAIKLPETSEAVETLLRLCHPLAPAPHFHTFDAMKGALALLWMYELRGGAGDRIARALESWLETEPVRVYVFAVEEDKLELMAAAAKASLRLAGTLADHEELDAISTRAYRRLLTYRGACAAKMADVASYKSVDDRRWVWRTCGCGAWEPRCLAPWFATFYASLAQALQTTPHPDTVRSMKDSDALKEAGRCSSKGDERCGTRAWKDLPCFLDELANEVERRISEVSPGLSCRRPLSQRN